MSICGGGRPPPIIQYNKELHMEFLFYLVACFGVIVISMPLFSIAKSLDMISKKEAAND